MRRKKDRLIIDTNLWISFLLTRDHSKLDQIFVKNSITLLFSQELLDEFISVALRPKFKKYFTTPDLQVLLEQIRLHAEFIEVVSVLDLCRDPKDNFLLSIAKDGMANFLLTGDQDLLILKKIGKTRILTFNEYFIKK
ncbi:MAG: putative toxin-antitoxin system toxin component, PIN family [Sphingobacteriaceae bacterium]